MRASGLTLAILLLFTTAIALMVSFTVRGINGSDWGVGLASAMYIVLINFGLFGILFLALYPLGKLNQFLDSQTETVQSPFAEDRLPDRQMEIPVDSESAH